MMQLQVVNTAGAENLEAQVPSKRLIQKGHVCEGFFAL
jgi:hypothetical protein